MPHARLVEFRIHGRTISAILENVVEGYDHSMREIISRFTHNGANT
ncbi:hypothetical protein [Labrenzia sp. CE80]|nr:hypothetical protein [Labrenzia sp. CE80]